MNLTDFYKQAELEKEVHYELKKLPPEAKDGKKIEQGFIKKVKDADVRIRRSGGQHTMTAKFRPKNQEFEMNISEDMFNSLWPFISSPQTKTRYRLNGWDVDHLKDGRIFAEYEYDDKDKVKVPKHWKLKDGEKTATGKTLKDYNKNRTPLDPDERKMVMLRKAIWHHGPNGEGTPAIWKSIDPKTGKTTFITNTHRAMNTASTVKGAINRYHKFIKGTA